MKNKTLSLFIAGIFAFVFLMSFASALTLSSSSLTFNDNNSKTITVTNNVSAINYDPSFTIGTIEFFVSLNETLAGVLTITPQDNIKDLDFNKEYSGSFLVWDDISEKKTVTVKVSNSDFCKYSDINYLNIEISDWSVAGYGDDDEWFPLDTIEIEVEIENSNNHDLENVEIEWGLYDEENEQWLFEVDDEDEFDLDEDEDETITFSFTLDKSVDLDDFEDLLDTGNIKLYVRATGTVDDSSSSYNNEKTCVYDTENFEVIIEKDFVILKNLEMPNSISCNSQLQISGEVWNIGSKDQDDIEVKIVIPDLDIEEYIEIEELKKDFDKEEFSLTLELPEDVQAGSYTIKFFVLDEDGDIYEADNDDELSTFSQTFTVVGDCSAAKVKVNATLYEGGKAGQPLTVKATLTNTGAKSATYLINIAGYNGWADSYELSQSSVTINSGNSADVLITFNTKKGIQGDQLFTLDVLSDSQLIASQPVSVPIEGSSGFLGITGFAINEGNWYVWGIILLDIIFVIVIIIIAVRIARRK